MKVSIVIPVYNEEKYLENCLQGFMRQIEPADEIIVVDNNSTDRSIEIAKKFPVKIIREKQQGMIFSRNRGFNEAQYDLILRTDADTVVPRDWVKRIKTYFKKDPALVAVSGPARFYDVSPSLVKISSLSVRLVFRSVNEILGHDSLFGPNMALRKTAWEKVRDEVCMNDKTVHEDIDLSIHISKYGKVKFMSRLVVNSSIRRWKRISPYFDYPYRYLRTIQVHKQLVWGEKGKQVVKKVIPARVLAYLRKPLN
jgi:glycosyltransferase involved in cell wall biosynthesis